MPEYSIETKVVWVTVLTADNEKHARKCIKETFLDEYNINLCNTEIVEITEVK